jgi:hypothetical protein
MTAATEYAEDQVHAAKYEKVLAGDKLLALIDEMFAGRVGQEEVDAAIAAYVAAIEKTRDARRRHAQMSRDEKDGVAGK